MHEKCTTHPQAPALVEALLRLYVQRPLPPPRAPLFAPAPVAKAAAEGGREGGAGAGLVGYMGQATVSLFTMPLRCEGEGSRFYMRFFCIVGFFSIIAQCILSIAN